MSGIVTLGDFRRNQLQGKDLINHKFNAFLLQDEDKIIDFFEENEKINAVPVIGTDGNIVREYYRKKPLEDIDFDDVIDICHSMKYMLTKYKLIYCVVSHLSEKDKERAKNFGKEYDNRMQIVEFVPFALLRENSFVFVYDFSVEHFRIREVLLQKYMIISKIPLKH